MANGAETVRRTADQIGAGLLPPRDPRSIQAGETIHFMGVGGAGSSGAALLASCLNADVTGCNDKDSEYMPQLRRQGIEVVVGHDPAHTSRTPPVVRLAVTKAITSDHPDHPELAAARSNNIPIEPWQQVVSDAAFTAGQELVAIAGTHGKSTSTGWLTHVLIAAGRDPSSFVGALFTDPANPSFQVSGRLGSGPHFIVEADEYAGNFDCYVPTVATLLNADWDHPDVFEDQAAAIDAFRRWLRPLFLDPSRTIVANVGHAGVRQLVDEMPSATNVVTAALSSEDHLAPGGTDVIGRRVPAVTGRPALELSGLGVPSTVIQLQVPGRHNASNAVVVAATALSLGISGSAILNHLSTFRGVHRRLEYKGMPQGVHIYDDYAHHPVAIEETLAAVREDHPGAGVWAVYEPLTHHRSIRMLQQFAEVLATADHVLLAPIWAGRDPNPSIVSSADLAAATNTVRTGCATWTESIGDTVEYLLDHVTGGDVVLVMGGGQSNLIAEGLARGLEAPGSSPVSDEVANRIAAESSNPSVD